MLRQSKIGAAELGILQHISDHHHPITVGEVAEHFAGTKGHARTTVQTVMERLHKKGFLSRKRVGGAYLYSPRMPKKELLQSLVRDFVEQALGGSLEPFVAYLTERAELSDEELKELEQLMRDVDERRKGSAP